ncbi:hypothetical protein ABPG73_003710 [Tetrahymena malaccensis]
MYLKSESQDMKLSQKSQKKNQSENNQKIKDLSMNLSNQSIHNTGSIQSLIKLRLDQKKQSFRQTMLQSSKNSKLSGKNNIQNEEQMLNRNLEKFQAFQDISYQKTVQQNLFGLKLFDNKESSDQYSQSQKRYSNFSKEDEKIEIDEEQIIQEKENNFSIQLPQIDFQCKQSLDKINCCLNQHTQNKQTQSNANQTETLINQQSFSKFQNQIQENQSKDCQNTDQNQNKPNNNTSFFQNQNNTKTLNLCQSPLSSDRTQQTKNNILPLTKINLQQLEKIKSIEDSQFVQQKLEKLKAIQNKHYYEKTFDNIFNFKFCRGSKYSFITQKSKDTIQKEVFKNLNIFELYKDVIFLKKAMMMILDTEQLSAIKHIGCSSFFLDHDKNIDSSTLSQLKQENRISYYEEQFAVLLSEELQYQQLSKFLQRCYKRENINKVDLRIYSSMI